MLEETDFESLGREMPKGSGISNSADDGTMVKATKRKNKKGNTMQKKPT
jgi:hypothetical protein